MLCLVVKKFCGNCNGRKIKRKNGVEIKVKVKFIIYFYL